MKRVLGYTFLIIFSSFSFYITHKTVNFIRQNDKAMNYLNEIETEYLIDSHEAIIDSDTIIPGLNGLKINKNESYNNLKKVGSFNANLLCYDTIPVKYELKNNKDKYIIQGNKKKNMVSIILYLDEHTDLALISDLKIPLNFIVSYNYFINNYEVISKLIIAGHNILISGTNDSNLIKISSKINNSKQKNNYCFNINKEESFKNNCYKNNYYSIYSNVITNNYTNTVKKDIKAGSFIILKGNYEKELELIISYIQSKGYKITNLDNHLLENM